MKYANLNNGCSIPLMGFGTASDVVHHEETKLAVSNAIEVGYRHFDTAAFYKTEAPLGEALSDAFRAGILRREDVFVTSKLWCSDNHPDDVIPAIKQSLTALQFDYLDLYLIHFPIRIRKGVGFPPESENDFLPLDTKATWQAMEKCVELGLTKAIGVSNFSSKKVGDLLTYAKVPPAVNQVELHPMWQQRKLREYCKNVNIHVSAWSPLGAPNTSWGSPLVIEHPIIQEVALKHGKTPAQVALRWGVEQGIIVLPKSYNKKRIIENFQIFDWQLTEEDHEKISKIEQKKTVRGEFVCNATTSPYKTVESLWDGEI